MNTRFGVAVHILTFLQTQEGRPATSELIASSVNTNPSLIRRLLSALAAAGLTTSKMGAGGGALLARSADRITLLDVFRAMDGGQELIPLHDSPNPRCPVGRNIQGLLEDRRAAVTSAVESVLAQTSIADLTKDLARRQRQRRR